MKTTAAILLFALFSLPAAAQSDVTLWLTTQSNESGGRFSPEEDVRVRFDSGSGFGAGFSRMLWQHVSGEIAVFKTSSSANVREGSANVADLGDIDLTPITASLRYHFRPGQTVDVYVGGGLAYVGVDDLDSPDLRTIGSAPVRLDNKTTASLGGGLLISFGKRWGVALDARYIPLEISGHIPDETGTVKVDMNPLLVSGGVRLRF